MKIGKDMSNKNQTGGVVKLVASRNYQGATGSDMVATVDYHSSGGGMRTYEGRTPLVE